MKKIRSYTSIWSVEKVIYAINDLHLPFPVTFSQMAWFVVSLIAVITLKKVPPLSFIESDILRYVAIPGGLTWFASQKTFDGKKPFSFIKSVVLYMIRPKLTFAFKQVKVKPNKININQEITIVRSKIYGAISNQVY